MVDEAHCILTWGKSDFRPAFLKLASLRAIVPHSKVLALTATATSDAQGEISKALLMKKKSLVAVSPDRLEVCWLSFCIPIMLNTNYIRSSFTLNYMS